MKNILIIISCCLAFGGYSQSKEVGGFLGLSYYTGDLNPYDHFYQSNLGLGIIFKNNFKDNRNVLRLHLKYGKVEAYDSESDNPFQVNRNLHFRSRIFEIAALWEINFFEFEPGNMKRNYFTPYLFFGLAYTNMNPQAKLNNDWFDLQPIGTEGQGTSANSTKPYSLNQVTIPFGIGFKFNLNKSIILGTEFGLRKMFTDYLDDVSGVYADPAILNTESGPITVDFADRSLNRTSTEGSNTGASRGLTDGTDWYYFTGVTITYNFGQPTCPQPR